MKKIMLIMLLTLSMKVLNAQTATDSIKATIDKLFTAMKNSDSSSLLQCFADSAYLQTIVKDMKGKVVVKNESIKEFAKQIASLSKGVADERIVYDAIKIDDELANAWTPYKFYYNTQFSHCGVNNFVLIKQNNEWKIQYIIDTRRRKGCN